MRNKWLRAPAKRCFSGEDAGSFGEKVFEVSQHKVCNEWRVEGRKPPAVVTLVNLKAFYKL